MEGLGSSCNKGNAVATDVNYQIMGTEKIKRSVTRWRHSIHHIAYRTANICSSTRVKENGSTPAADELALHIYQPNFLNAIKKESHSAIFFSKLSTTFNPQTQTMKQQRRTKNKIGSRTGMSQISAFLYQNCGLKASDNWKNTEEEDSHQRRRRQMMIGEVDFLGFWNRISRLMREYNNTNKIIKCAIGLD